MNMELNSHLELVFMSMSAIKAFEQVCTANETANLYS